MVDIKKLAESKSKGQMSFLSGNMVGLVVVIVLLVFAAIIVQSLQDTQTSGTAAHNVTVDGLEAFENVSDQLPILGLIIIAVLIIGFMLLAFRGRRGGGGV